MRIIHLSDLHIDKVDFSEINLTINDLLDKLYEIHQQKEIDLIIFTGDLINTGGVSYGKIETAFSTFKIAFIDVLIKKLNIDPTRFIFTPGNHDINRNADSSRIEKALVDEFVSIDSVNKFIDEKTEEGIKRILPYKKFENDFYSKIYTKENFYCTNFESCFKLNIGDCSIGIASINSAWRCYNSKADKGKILIGERQITKSVEFLRDCKIKIALSHHHFSWMSEFECKRVEELITKNFDIYFCGHTHSKEASLSDNLSGIILTSVAQGTLSQNKYNEKEYENGFSLIDYDIVKEEVIFEFFNYKHPSGFKLNEQIGDKGIWKRQISLGKNVSSGIQKLKVLSNIKEELPTLNEHLLSYGTTSKAPKSLSEIFVMPNIVKCSNEDNKEAIISNFTEIISSQDNYIIFGIKEVGKTVLLDKLLFDILNTTSSCTQIPVRLEFSIIQTDLVSTISKIWKKNKTETHSLLQAECVTLLIDDINFIDREKLNNLNIFVKKYDKVRFIGTSLLLFEDDLSVSIDEYETLKYTKLVLKQFKSQQIKKLIGKWFPDIPKQEKPKKFGTLINAFLSLNLPRTPFAVSMFLWIIERQQIYRPQNNATLIEKFIEEILDKKSIKDSYRDHFDYENKISLLSEIAYNMLLEDKSNYSLSYSKLIEIVEKHLKARRFTNLFKTREITDQLINVGILVDEGSLIRFRFNCFFEYFLVKKMERDPAFLNYVLTEENYLKFVNEIDYFTGLNRGNKYILKTIIDRLEYSYIDVNDIVFSRVKSIDDYFNVNKSIITAIKAEELFNLLPDKKTEEEDEHQNDVKLEKCDSGETVIKKENTEKFLSYGILLQLAMKVLKNLEEIDEENLKSESYATIIKNSISFGIFYQMICELIIKYEDRFAKERVEEVEIILRFITPIIQNFISNNLSTYKLAEVIKEKIEQDKLDDTSEFERLISVFIYADIKGIRYKDVVNEFIKSINKNYIADACYFKLYAYYYNSNSQSEDKSILNSMVDLYIKVNSKKDPNKSFNKGKIIQDFQEQRRRMIDENKI